MPSRRAAARYAELRCRSNFSFLDGASHPEELAERGAALGLAGLALTDRDGLYGMVRFTKAALRAGLAAICGAEMTFASGERIVLLAESRDGYANLARAISTAQLRGKKRDARLLLDDLSGHTAGLSALSGWREGYVEAALLRGDADDACVRAAALRDCFAGKFYLELQHHLRSDDARLVRASLDVAARSGVPCVATNGVAYAEPHDAALADVLACIRNKTTLAAAGSLLRPNHEFYLKSPQQMVRIFAPYPHALANTLAIAERCTFRLDTLAGQFPAFPIPAGETSPHSYLRTLVFKGAADRYGSPLSPKAERQLEYELGIIARMDLAGYFLIVWDIVRAAAELRVLCQGRGSAANSADCYALGITAVDPIAHDLLFERFLSEERNEIPDIDIDFAHQDRERVIQYIYDRYDREHAAMAAEVITYRTRSAIRDVGKAIGLSLAQVDAIAKEYDARESLAGAAGVDAATAADLDKHLPDSIQRRRDLDAGSNIRASRNEPPEPAGTDPNPGPIGGKIGAMLLRFCWRIDGFPRHRGIHSGGMVITRDPLVSVAPVEWATMRDRTIVQWDKDDLGDLGLIKIDLLGLGMLSLLRDAFALHARCYPQRAPLSLASIPPGDAPTYAMLQRADSIGVFQVESRAQQSMLPRLRPACFYDLVMQVAIIRPGPIQGDMVHPFLRRRNGQEPVSYPHPKLKQVLERTLGVPLFQEQGMRIAIEAAGFTPGQADQLRRAMGHKRSRERMAQIYPKLIDGMVGNGIDRAAAEQLFHMLEGFADYGFPESHAASFALLSYASAYVKCHEPAIFCAAILNVQPMGFYSTEVLVNDAKRHGVVVEPVAVNASEFLSFVDAAGAVRLGFHLVRGLGEAQRTDLERALRDGPFADLREFARRTKLGRDAIENLAIADAVAPWSGSRREAMWALRALNEREARGELGRAMEIDEPAPELRPLSPIERTRLDVWSLGLSPAIQPIAHLRVQLTARGVIPAAQLTAMPNHLVCTVGGMVITRQRPGTAKGFVFLTLEDETGLVNVIVNPQVYERNRRVIRSSPALVIEGVLQHEQGCIDVLARRFWPLAAGDLIAGIHPRNFH